MHSCELRKRVGRLYMEVINQENQRSGNIELYRCLLMFGICFLHVLGYSGYNLLNVCGCLAWCVNAFAFITGWYGTSFKILKVAKLYGVALIAFPVGMLFGHLVCGVTLEDVLLLSWKAFLGLKFLHWYVICMCFAPIIDCALNKFKESRQLRDIKFMIPFFVMCFSWSWLTDFNFSRPFIPCLDGLGGYTYLSIVAAYAFGRICRHLELDKKIGTRNLLRVLIVCMIPAYFRVATYASIFANMIAASTFLLFARMKRSGRLVSKAAVLIGPSTFAIFLMHSQFWFYKNISAWCHNVYNGDNSFISFFVCFLFGVVVFFGALILDIPRRLVVILLRTSGVVP